MLDMAARWTGRRVGLAVVYHGLGTPVADSDGEVSSTLDAAVFARQVTALRRRYRLVPASELAAAAAARGRGRRFPLALTFDDDLRSHVEVAAPVLAMLGAPATFFLTGASLSKPQTFWWQRLQRAVDAGLQPDDPVLGPARVVAGASAGPRELGERVRALAPAERDSVSQALLAYCGGEPADAGLSAERVSWLVGAGFEVGFHTARHDSLPDLDDRELASALTEGRDPVARLAPTASAVVAYPHGRADLRVADAARRAGYRSGFTTDHCPFRIGEDPLRIGRFEPPAASSAALEARLAKATGGRLVQGRARRLARLLLGRPSA